MAITNGNVGSGQTVDVLTVPAGKSYAITSVLITNTVSYTHLRAHET